MSSGLKIGGLVCLLLFFVLAGSVSATTYWVATDGDDANDGLSPASAWLSIDNGDATGVLLPGDTVYIIPGTYTPTSTYELTLSGTDGAPIVYRCHGQSPMLIDGLNASGAVIKMSGSNTILCGFRILNAKDDAIQVKADSCTVRKSFIADAGKRGIRVESSYGRFFYNTIVRTGDRGIENESSGEFDNVFYNNTIAYCDNHALELHGTSTARVINNNICYNIGTGIKADAANIAAYNNLFGNGNNLDGVVDSAGSISKNPRFIDPVANRFDVDANSLLIDAGLDLGFPFSGLAPEPGAYEKNNTYYVSPIGDDADDGLAPATAWRSLGNGGPITRPGDTVKILAGLYTEAQAIVDTGLIDEHIVFQGVPDSTILDGSAATTALLLTAQNVTVSGLTIKNAQNNNLTVVGGHNDLVDCRFIDAGEYGLLIESGFSNLVLRSVFAGNTLSSILAEDDSTLIYNSTFYDTGPYGINVGTTKYHQMRNNVMVSAVGSNVAIRATATTLIEYTCFYNYSLNAEGGASTKTGCITANPLLLDPALGIFRLGSLSPAINAGTDIGYPFSGKAPDMGAFETGPLVSLDITPKPDSMFADSSYAFDVVALDADGWPASPGTITWVHSFSSGELSTGGLFKPDLIGVGDISAESDIGGLTGSTGPIKVVPGALTTLTITPGSATVSADSTLQFAASGFDLHGNAVADPGTLSWSRLGRIGEIDNAGLFTAGEAGRGFIEVSSEFGVTGRSDTITVVPGDYVDLTIVPQQTVVEVGSNQEFVAYGLDADSNYIKELTDSVSWWTSDLLGSVNNGVYSPGLIPGSYIVRALYLGVADTANVTTTLGALDYIRIELADGTPVGDLSRSTDIDTIVFYCRGYDAGDGLLGDISVTWSLVDGSIGQVQAGPNTESRLTLTTPGTGRVVAIHSGGLRDSTGVITCVAGSPSQLQINPTSATLTADSSVIFSAVSLDADGNPSEPGVVANWSLIGAIGSINAGGLFSPTTVGTGFVVASGAGLADTAGPVIVTPGPLATLVIQPDTAVVSADTTRQFSVSGYDAEGNTQAVGTITWSLLDAIGSIDASGLFTPGAPGVSRVVAESSDGPIDTSAVLEVIAGRLTALTIWPDSVEVASDETAQFTATGVDQFGNPTTVGGLTWSSVAGHGDINSDGVYTPISLGIDRVAVTSTINGVSDTTQAVVITPGALFRLVVSPDTAVLGVGVQQQFTAAAYDESFNPLTVDSLSWSVTGGIGLIDDSGLFTATAPGSGVVIATAPGGVSDSTGVVLVEGLQATVVPLGSTTAWPGQELVPVLAIDLRNPLTNTKYLTELAIRPTPRGGGTTVQMAGTIDSVVLYRDTDHDSVLTAGDVRLAKTAVDPIRSSFVFSPLALETDSVVTLLCGLYLSTMPHDGDSLDYCLLPAQDITIADSTFVAGSDTLNSLGYVVVDGLVGRQIDLQVLAADTIAPSNQMVALAALDLPSNGYLPDTLDEISIRNIGTATENDFDSIVLYADNGNDSWGGPAEEIRLGKMAFTGTQWTRSGIGAAIAGPARRFYVAADIAAYPTDGGTIVLMIPSLGVDMYSFNDGPIDGPLVSVDTVVISTDEQLSVTLTQIKGRSLIPGGNSGPMLGLTLVNEFAGARTLDTLRVQFISSDPAAGTDVLDSQVDSIGLYRMIGNEIGVLDDNDSMLAVTTLVSGEALFALSGVSCPGAGNSIRLALVAFLNLTQPRNGNTLGLEISGAADMVFAPATSPAGSFPLRNDELFTVNAFPAAAVAVAPVAEDNIFGGETRVLVMDMRLPSNGYAADTLSAINLRNQGTLAEASALTSVRLYFDRTGDGFTPDDPLAGGFAYNAQADIWSMSHLTLPIEPGGNRVFVGINVATDRFEGGTLEFEIPTGGLWYRSGMIGPDDMPVANSSSHLVVPSNRVTVISIPGNSTTVAPGDARVGLLTFALYNGFLDQTRTLSSLTLNNSTLSRSSDAFADAECGQVSLYLDSDGDRIFSSDSLLGSGYFSDGQLTLSGLDVALPAESLSYFFVVADIPETVIDSDSLAVSVLSATDMVFTEPANLNGDLPLSSGGYAVIDGSVKRQYSLLSIQPRTLSPGDTDIVLLAIRPAINGDLADTLQSLTIGNTETADGTDLTNLQVWLDANGDDTWQLSDTPVGAMAYFGGQWTVSGLAIELTDPPPALFVTGDVAAGATPNASFRPVLPINGCQYGSANDGPRDSSLISPASFVISSSGLRITYQGLNPDYSVGQTIALRFIATNLLAGTLAAVTGEIVQISDSSLVTLDSSIAGPTTLATGEFTEFVYYYTAANAGSVNWQLQCVAGLPIDSSAVVNTGTIDIQTVPSFANARLINTIPASVTRGQQNVFPLSLRLTHGDLAPTAAAIRLAGLSLDIEASDGTAQSAADVFSRLVLATGYTNLTILESIPDQSRLDLVFDQPVVVTPGSSLQFTLLTDIADSATAANFVVAISGAVSVPAVDDNTLQAIPITATPSFPLKTASCRIDDPSEELAIANVSPSVPAVNVGQSSVTMLSLGVRHPGVAGSSQIQLSGLSLKAVSGTGDTLSPVDVLKRVRVMNQQTQLGETWWPEFGADRIDIQLAAPLTLAPGEVQTVNIVASLADQVVVPSLAFVIPDSQQFVIRDLSSGSVVDAVTDKNALATGSVFPVASTVAAIKQPAIDPLVCAEPILPLSLVGGVDSLPLFRFTVTYPNDSNVSSAAWNSVVLTTLDSLARPLDPDRLFDRIGYRLNGVTSYQSFVDLYGGGVRFTFGTNGIAIAPGDSVTVELIADIESDVPYDHFMTIVQNEGAVVLHDITDTSLHPTLALQSTCADMFPLEAGPATVFLPAGRPNLSLTQSPVQVVFPGQQQVPIAQLDLAYTPPSLQGDIAITGLTGRLTRRTETGRLPQDAAELFDRVSLRIGDQVVAVDSMPIGDSVVLTIPGGFVMNRGETNSVLLMADLSGAPLSGNYQLVFDDSLFLAVEDNNLATTVFPSLSSSSYPLLGTELSLAAASLKESFSNYPNPFVASRGDGTTLAFVLPEDGYVDVEIFTVTGERVLSLASNDYRAAGSHQDLRWFGDNATGLDIAPGTYFCRIVARYVSGRTEEVRRKIAVLR